MSNHVHLMAAALDEKLSAVLRDFKKFTSKQIIKAIEQNNGEKPKGLDVKSI
jgi:putative transposase